MKTRSPYAVAAAVAVVLAFAVGGVSTAAGGALTKGAVKKIAAKVVKKQAPSLSVAHAADAATLTGSTAAQLKTTGIKYVLPVQDAAQIREYSFPGLTSGTYLVSYSLSAVTSVAGTVLQCSVRPDTGTGAGAAAGYGAGNGFAFNRINASAIVTMTATSRLRCVSAGGTYTLNENESTVSLVPIDLPATRDALGVDLSP